MKDIYNRQYTKLQLVLANLGGIMKFIFTVSSIIVYLINDNLFYVNMANQFFDYQNKENDPITIVKVNNKEDFNLKMSFIKRLCPSKIHKDSIKLMKDKLSIDSILKLMEEFEKLKIYILKTENLDNFEEFFHNKFNFYEYKTNLNKNNKISIVFNERSSNNLSNLKLVNALNK